MRSCISAAMVLVVLLFGVPWLWAGAEGPGAVEKPPAEEETVFPVWDGAQVVEMTMEEYLPGVVRGEMPASFEMEALKAQAVAERTYIYYKMSDGGKPNHPEANLCMDSTCCNAYTSYETAAERWGENAEAYEARIQEAVRSTAGQVLLYENAPIFAAYHSSSDGVTANSGDVWSKNLPYLTSVESPEGEELVPNYYSVATFTPDEFREIFTAAHAEAQWGEDVVAWVGEMTHNPSGRVESIVIGGVTVEGTEVRSLYSLRSASFTVEATAEGITFRVTGYGHGVGMSQYGANALAKEGKTWQEILLWYYTGVTIATYTPPVQK